MAFLAHESKAALLFLHVNPPKQQNVSFQKYKINFLTICYYFREHLSKSRILYINLIWTWNLAKKVWFLGKIFVFLFGFVDVRISIHFTKHVDWGILNCSTYLLLKNKKIKTSYIILFRDLYDLPRFCEIKIKHKPEGCVSLTRILPLNKILQIIYL